MSNVIKIILNKPIFDNKNTWKNSRIFSFIWKHRELIAALFSGLLILSAWLLHDSLPERSWTIILLSAFIIGGYAKAKEGITETISEKKLNVELLMIMAAIGAASIGYWTEGAILIFIFALSGALETYTENKSEKELESLMNLQPETATLLNNKQVKVSKLQIGDHIIIKAGERVPADGVITKGETSIDESALSGEAIPVIKNAEDNVFAGTVNMNGTLFVEIHTLPDQTLFQKIIQLVQHAQNERSPSQQFIERFESTYVKVVLVSVGFMMFLPHFLFGWSWTDTIYRAMILLVVASPCALVAAIMPATLSAISNSARNGVLFKGGMYVEGLSTIDTIAFDKTGTLTKGEPVVTDAFIHSAYSYPYIADVIYAIENESNHPLAQTMTVWARDNKKDTTVTVEDVKHINGKGLKGCIDNEEWFIGNKAMVGDSQAEEFINAQGVNTDLHVEKTMVFVKKAEEVIAIFLLKDTLRKDSIEAIETLNKMGIKTVMLTGDNKSTAAAIAKEANIDEFYANCLPEDKVTHLKQLAENNQKVAMIGDGINDAPALATANIGIAMGAGSDIALETADVVLIKNKLSKIVKAVNLSKKMNRIIKQNIVFSIAVILTLIASNFLQLIDMPLGVIGHEGSTILVILNGLRLLTLK
ncbi:heavy metal translocating P-type ATPase [Gracilibacillus kekensis]|uniref:Cd2+/Zn2+-exporting ATPase n=1 Tax=Gracilibacillus kekensis TaxID=1027249 RepID=A0A1M7QCA9_9BACI|nr:heavy metal translocating P-type ATPase [Gracilibacillus kekensis]SHN28168.1 Cd2+/Zn2+-exporting ATPase [Gracilibacillus kekensis]